MSQVNGQLTTCERCGAQIFRKTIGEGQTDGGYTRWNEFEPYPEGWEVVSLPKVNGQHQSAMVCPFCYAEWDRVLNSFFIAGTDLEKPEEAQT